MWSKPTQKWDLCLRRLERDSRSTCIFRVALETFHDDEAGGVDHFSVVESLKFDEFRLWVADDLEHAPEIGGFLVAPKQFQLAVSGDEDNWRGVGSCVVEWGEGIDDGLFTWDSSFFPRGEMRDGVPAEREKPRDLVGVHAVSAEIGFVESNHAGQVASSRMPGDIN